MFDARRIITDRFCQPSATSRVHLAMLLAGLPMVVQSKYSAAADDRPPIERAIEGWGKRLDLLPVIRYQLEGTRTWTKGSLNDHAKNIPIELAGLDMPAEDVIAKFERTVLFDFSRNRYRIDWDEPDYDMETRSLFRIRCNYAFDGRDLYSRILENTTPGMGIGKAKKHVDVIVSHGLLPMGIFTINYMPLFVAHGIISYGENRPLAGQLIARPRLKDFLYHGTAVHKGRTCTLFRTVRSADENGSELWVDLEREAAVVKAIRSPGPHPTSQLEINYALTPDGWLPTDWTREQFDNGVLTFAERVRVEKVEPRPAVSDDDYRIKLTPGLYVRDCTYFIDPQTKKYKNTSRYYREEPSGVATELDQNLYPKHPTKNDRAFWMIGSTVLLISVLVCRVLLGRRSRKQRTDLK